MLGARGVQVFTGLLYYAYTIEGDLYSSYDRGDAFPSEPSSLRVHLQIFRAFYKEVREILRCNDVFWVTCFWPWRARILVVQVLLETSAARICLPDHRKRNILICED